MMRSNCRARRSGFTFVEILFVVAIMAVLAALLLAAVQRVLIMQARTETQQEITKIAQSLEVARTKYNDAPYLPSQLYLFNDTTAYNNPNHPVVSKLPQADRDLVKKTGLVLRNMFGKRFVSNGGTVTWTTGGQNGSIKIKGAECLVFYLGGMPSGGKCTGFSMEPVNPTIPAQQEPGKERLGPFYTFRTNKLATGASNTYLVYKDPYDVPYAYFAPYGDNGYFADAATECANYDGKNGLGSGPYAEATNKFISPKLYQIVSAGKDKRFGPGGIWVPSRGNPNGETADNLANFSSTELGNPQE